MSDEAYPLATPEALRRYREGVSGVRDALAFSAPPTESDTNQAIILAGEIVNGWRANDAMYFLPLVQAFASVREEGRREPRPITEAMVEAAAHGICRASPTSSVCCKCGFNTDYQCGLFGRYSSDARAALEAAEAAR